MSAPTPASIDESSEPIAWQPLTPRGVANFADATWGRLLLVQFAIGIFAAGCVIWFLNTNYAPIISEAVLKTREETRLANGKLLDAPAALLSNGKFLSILSNPAESGESGTGDVQVALKPLGWSVCSLFGCLDLPYPSGIFSLAPATLDPQWGAWKPAILSCIGAATIVGLMLIWLLLGLIYVMVPLVIAFFADRRLTPAGSWKLAAAAQLPGAVFASVMILLYGLQALDIVRFLVFFSVHLLVSIAYLFSAPFFLPRTAEKKRNPFVTGP